MSNIDRKGKTMYDPEYSCTKCGKLVELDSTEGLWGCDCFATGMAYDDGGEGGLEYIPDYWVNNPIIVCLCGSTRFWREFQQAGLEETLAGKIVLSIGAASGTDDEHFGNLPREEYDRIKAELDWLHLRKIDLADEVLVLNVGGYIGESTRREIEYAKTYNKKIRWLVGNPDKKSATCEYCGSDYWAFANCPNCGH